MAKRKTVEVSELLEAKSTPDGSHALLKIAETDGSERILSLPRAKLLDCVSAAAHALLATAASQGLPKTRLDWFEAVAWRTSSVPDYDGTILTLTLTNGGTLSFRLNRSLMTSLFDSLANQLGKIEIPPEGTRRH